MKLQTRVVALIGAAAVAAVATSLPAADAAKPDRTSPSLEKYNARCVQEGGVADPRIAFSCRGTADAPYLSTRALFQLEDYCESFPGYVLFFGRQTILDVPADQTGVHLAFCDIPA